MADFLTTPVPHSEGADFLRNKPAVTRAIFDALAPELQAKAFVITGVESLEVVARVRDLAARLPEGGDYDEIKGDILKELTPWLVTSDDPEERAKQERAASRRSELLLRMHGWQAYARTKHAMIMANIDVFPFCEYLSTEDARVRPVHAALHGKIIPTDHPFWETHTPPWEFGCRCDKVPWMQDDVAEIWDSEKELPLEERRVLNDYQLEKLAKGEIFGRGKKGSLGWIDIRTPYERNGSNGYEWRVGNDAFSVDQILSRYSSEEKDAFEEFAGEQTLEDGRTLLDWWQEGRAAANAAPANVPPLPGRVAANVFEETPLPGAAGGEPRFVELAKDLLEGQAVPAVVPGPVESMPPQVRALVAARENSIRHLGVEHGSLFELTGGRKDFVGTVGDVELPEAVAAAGMIFTHVHPGGRSFSLADVRLLIRRRLAEVRAETRSGDFSVHPVEGVRLGAIEDRIYQISPDIIASLEALNADYSERERGLVAEHLIWSVLAREGLIYYSYTPMRPELPILDTLSATPPDDYPVDTGRNFYTPPLEEVLAFLRGEANFPGLENPTGGMNPAVR